MTFNLLEYARRTGVSGVILASSREVYGSGRSARSESETRVDRCANPYAAGKVASEAMADSYARCYDLRTATLRFSNVYGRYDRSDRVVPRFIARAHRGQDLTVYGRDKTLDFLYLEDCVDGILLAIENFQRAAGETFNIASGEGTSLEQLADEVIAQTPHRVGIDRRANRTGETTQFVADISKARTALGYAPSRSPLGGLAETVEWYRDEGRLDCI
jgi:UDP-glucose 4-epimerase